MTKFHHQHRRHHPLLVTTSFTTSQPPIIRPVPLVLTRCSLRYSLLSPTAAQPSQRLYDHLRQTSTVYDPLTPHSSSPAYTITHAAVSYVHDLHTPPSSTPEYRRWCLPVHTRRKKQSSGTACAGTRPTSVTVRLEKLRALPTHEEQTSTRQPFTTERLQPQKHQQRRL
jgi:hypothetical protein